MAHGTRKPCTTPRCPYRTTRGGKCPKCKAEQQHAIDQRRGGARQRGYNREWELFRKEFLQAHPMCEHEEGCDMLASEVHHLDGLGPKGPRGFDPTNCQALCQRHHKSTTAKQQPGGFNA